MKPIPGHEGRYSVTAMGNVWAHEKTRVMPHGGTRTYPARWLSPQLSRDGYLLVTLCTNGRTQTFSVHRLVALAWLPNPNGYRNVNHRDGDKTRNAADNLEWCTTSHNNLHAWKTGLRTSSEAHKENMRRAQTIGAAQKRARACAL